MKVAVLFLLVSLAEAQTWWAPNSYVLNSCNSAMLKLATFCEDVPQWGFGTCACMNQPAMATVLQCVYDRGGDTDALLDTFASKCEMHATLTRKDFEESYSNATDYWVDLDNPPEGYNAFEMSYRPIRNGKMPDYFMGYYMAAKVRYTNKDNSQFLGMGFAGLWAVILLAATIANWTARLAPSVLKGVVSHKYRQFVGLPAFHRRHIQSVGNFGYLPTRLESLIIFVSFVYLVLATCIGYSYDPRDMTFTKTAAIGRYIGDRSGIICAYMGPFVFLFAGRNNFLQWCTGWSFSSFITYHKWLSRFYMMEVIVHSVAMAVNSAAYGLWWSRLASGWYRWGIVASVAGGIMLILSVFALRRASYEVFLFIHIVLAAIFLAGSWIHVLDLSYGEFYYAAAAVWVFDAAVRIARLSVFGVRKATVELVDDMLKVSVSKPRYWRAAPGAHGFVHFVTPGLFWQSHPFCFVANGNTLQFYIKVKNGATRSMQRHLLKNSVCSVPIAVEGPYGESSAYENYDRAVLIAGGNGIPGPFAHAADLANGDTEVKLIWSIREYCSLRWFHDELLTLKDTNVKVTVYVSSPDMSRQDESSSSSDSVSEKDTQPVASQVPSILDDLSFVEFKTGRIDLEGVIRSEVETASSVAFGVCGHASMTDHARATVASLVGQSQKQIGYFEEMQIW